jgi:hypothetical protein
MANVHGGNLHHIHVYADTEILLARLLIILSMARRISTRLPIPFCRIPPTFVKNDKISSYYFLFKCTYFIESSNFSRNFN